VTLNRRVAECLRARRSPFGTLSHCYRWPPLRPRPKSENLGYWDAKSGASESLICALPGVTHEVPGVPLLQDSCIAAGTAAAASGAAKIATAAAPAVSTGAMLGQFEVHGEFSFDDGRSDSGLLPGCPVRERMSSPLASICVSRPPESTGMPALVVVGAACGPLNSIPFGAGANREAIMGGCP
jgi:hypothetical protein